VQDKIAGSPGGPAAGRTFLWSNVERSGSVGQGPVMRNALALACHLVSRGSSAASTSGWWTPEEPNEVINDRVEHLRGSAPGQMVQASGPLRRSRSKYQLERVIHAILTKR